MPPDRGACDEIEAFAQRSAHLRFELFEQDRGVEPAIAAARKRQHLEATAGIDDIIAFENEAFLVAPFLSHGFSTERRAILP